MVTADVLVGLLDEAGMQRSCAIVDELDGASAVARDDEDDIYPASMLKTPLSLAALLLVDSGELKLEDRHVVTAENMTVNDMPSPLVPRYESTLQELIDLAITRSDNVATNMLYDIVGRDRATELCRTRLGLTNTAFRRKLSGDYPLIHDPQWDGVHMNRHSARDAARVFRLLAEDRVPFASHLRETLGRQQWNNKLSVGLHAGDRFAHKTGDTDEVTHDGGILTLEDGRRFVVVVYCGMPSSDENNARFGRLMRSLRDLL